MKAIALLFTLAALLALANRHAPGNRDHGHPWHARPVAAWPWEK